jgi:membrane-associated phospholipid phosphatase
VGSELLRAQLLAQTISGAIKVTVNRTRPDGTNLSFPSGHAAVSFASATVLHRQFGWKAGVPAFALATYIGASRIQSKRHYLSDVAFGAAIGIASGRTITIGKGETRFSVTPMPLSGGAGLSITLVGRPD